MEHRTDPPSLDYARPALAARRFTARHVVIVAVLLLASFAIFVTLKFTARPAFVAPTASPSNAYWYFDADVKGTEVYHRGKLLGVVPLELSQRQVADLGFDTKNASYRLGLDGWAEGVFFGLEDDHEERFMFRVPDAVAASHVSIETPWGRRTKIGGGGKGTSLYPNGFDCPMWVRSTTGMAISIEPLPVVKVGQDVRARIHFTNLGPNVLHGFRPDVTLHWGAFDTPWRRRRSVTIALPDIMKDLPVGQSHVQDITFPSPDMAGDYSVFATWFLFKDEQSDHGINTGDGYSDSLMLRVR